MNEPSNADFVLVGCFLLMVLAVIVIAFVATRDPILVPVFEVVDVRPGKVDLGELGLT